MIGPDEIDVSLARIVRETEHANVLSDLRQVAGRLATTTSLDSELAGVLVEAAAKVMRVEARTLDQERRDCRDTDDTVGEHAYRIGCAQAHLLAEITLPGVQEQLDRLAGIFHDPADYIAREKEPIQ
jgi:hypothetical protein